MDNNLNIKLSYRNQVHDFKISNKLKLIELKEHIQLITKVPTSLQKLMSPSKF